MNVQISTLLRYLDCAPAEAQTFIEIFDEPDGITIKSLSAKTNIARPTLYGYVHALIAKGLVKNGTDDDGSHYYAESLDTINSLFHEKERLVAYAREQVTHALESRREGAETRTSHRPKLFFFDNPAAAEEVLRDILRSREKEVFWFWPIKDMLSVVSPEVMRYFHEERIRRGIHLYSLWPKQQVVNVEKFPQIGKNDSAIMLREIRILPKEVETLLGYGIYGKRVGFVASKRESYGFILDSFDLSQTLKNQFRYWWNQSKPLK